MPTATSKETVSNRLTAGQKMKNLLLTEFPVFALIAVIIIFYFATDGKLFSKFNLKSISQQLYLFILGGLGCVFLFAQGAMDLSTAAGVGAAAIIGARVMQTNLLMGVIVTILVGVLIGVVNGLIYAHIGIPIFIQGLGVNFMLNGLLLPLCAGQATIRVPMELTALKSTGGEIVIEIIFTIIIALLFNFTRFGKDSRAIGAGEEAAFQSGVNIKKTKFLAFLVSGLLIGVVALMTLIRTGSASQTTGANFNFNVLMTIVLGGALLSGGNGVKVHHAVIGAALLIILQNGLVLLGMDARMQDILKGVLFIIMIVLTMRFSQKVKR